MPAGGDEHKALFEHGGVAQLVHGPAAPSIGLGIGQAAVRQRLERARNAIKIQREALDDDISRRNGRIDPIHVVALHAAAGRFRPAAEAARAGPDVQMAQLEQLRLRPLREAGEKRAGDGHGVALLALRAGVEDEDSHA